MHVEFVPTMHDAVVMLTFAPQSNPEHRGVMIPDWNVNGTETASRRIAATTTIRMFLRLLDVGSVSSAPVWSSHLSVRETKLHLGLRNARFRSARRVRWVRNDSGRIGLSQRVEENQTP